MERRERLGVKTRLSTADCRLSTVTDLFPTANFHEREVFDFFGVEFEGHPDMRRILMPEDYEGHPQRRDFPIGGEPVLFTFNEHELPRWYD
jgi:NADH-quinone oxidoreductase subunit C